jgi:hypothetical protein
VGGAVGGGFNELRGDVAVDGGPCAHKVAVAVPGVASVGV